jgi:Carboxypeptidase regulatory-like domain
MSHRFRAPKSRSFRALLVGLLATASSPVLAQAPLRQIAEMKLSVLGISATVDPLNPTVPKNIEAGVRIVLNVGGAPASPADATRFFGAGFTVQGELSGPGLAVTQTLSTSAESADPLILPLPALPTSGDYDLSNLRILSSKGEIVLEVEPRHLTVKVIEQVLITSVKTRPLTLDEIRAKGIILDSDDYIAFEFTLGLKLESKTVDISFPVAFDRNGVPVPQFLTPPPSPSREADLPPLPAIVPVLFEVDGEGAGPGGGGERLPALPNGGGEVRIPAVVVIPGQVGYLKQFFSAKLYVANGAPVGAGLSVRDITGTIALPAGPDGKLGTKDDPLALPKLLRDGQEITQPLTMDIRGVGPDGEPGTGDDEGSLDPGAQAEAEFLLRGEHEGFHTIGFDIKAVLDGLVTGPVKIKGKASGAVLVRNAFFDVSFTVPGVVRAGETFKVFVTLTNLGQATANKVNLTLPAGVGPSGAKLLGNLPPEIPSIGPRESKTLTLQFLALKTGQVVASYLQFDPLDEEQQRPVGSLQLAVGIGERGIPLSPDTLVLPAAVDELPLSVVEAAMRVLGQAWSVANAPAGTLPSDVIRTSRAVVIQKALALAEAGLRVSLGQPERDALRDIAFDFWGGQTLDAGFDQLLRTTDAGDELRGALGAELGAGDGASDPLSLEAGVAQVAASGPDFVSFAVRSNPGAPLGIFVLDAAGHRTTNMVLEPGKRPPSDVPSAALLPLGPEAGDPVLGVVASASGGPHIVQLWSGVATTADLSVTFPKGDGTFVHGDFPGIHFQAGTVVRAALDQTQPDRILLDFDEESVVYGGVPLESEGPNLVSATLIGPETLQGASPFGFQMVALFDRIVEAASAEKKESYQVPKNGIQGAKRQLSGRLVFLSLEQPEGPYVPTTLGVLGGVTDPRGKEGPSGSMAVGSRLVDPGAIVTGRVFQADGTPVTSGVVTYVNNSDLSCRWPNETGFAALPLDAEGHYEFRYVRQDNCGLPFKIVTQDPATNGRSEVSARVRAAGEAITLDLALFGRGSVQGTVRDVTGTAVPGASVVALSQTDPQIGGTDKTDAVGHYRIDGITVGPIVVKAGKGSGVGSAAGRIERSGAVATVNVVLDGNAVRVFGTVRKRMAGAGDSEPVPGAHVSFKHFDAQSPVGQTLGATTTDLHGFYEFKGMPVGLFQVSASIGQGDGDTQSGNAVLGVDSEVNLLITIPVPAELATVKGQVYLPDTLTPATDVVVSINNRGVMSADGSFTISGVPLSANAQTVSARTRDGRRSGSTTVVANQPKEYGGLEIFLSGLGTGAFRVLDEKGVPVKGQQVALLGNCGNPCGCRVANTDTDGVARFDNLSYGSFTAQALRSGATFTDVTRASLSIVADDTTVLSTMQYRGGGMVEGTVRDHLGNGLFGADVLLWANHFVYDGATCGLQNGYVAKTRTDLQGRYKFAGLNVGGVSVSATQPFVTGSAGNRGEIAKAGDVVTLDVKFDDTMAGILKGMVFLPGSGKQPVGEGVEVTVVGQLPEVKATTLADGTYEFPHILPEGYYVLTARDPVGGGQARLNVALKRQEDLVLDVHLKGRGSVRVLAVEGDDIPLQAAVVRLHETAFPSRSFDQTLRPENQGIVTFLDVYEGPVRVEVSDPFARSGSATAIVPGPDQEVSVKVKVTPTGRVNGRFLMPAGTPIPYGTVKLTAGGRVIGQATTLGSGDVGRFAFDFVPVGPVNLDAQDPLTARTGSAAGTLDHEGDPPLELDVKAQGLGRVVGTVRRGKDVQGLALVKVVSGAYEASTLTNGQGYYEVEGVPQGRVTVTASLSAQGFLAGSNSTALEEDGQEIRIDVALRDAGSVAGRVLPASQADRDAGRYPPALVKLYVGGTGGGAQQTNTRPDGTFSFEIVPVGQVSFTADVVDSIDRGTAVLDVAPGPNSVEIPLNGVGSLTGKVVKEEALKEGVEGWISFSGTAFPMGATVQLGNDGLFALPQVLAGEFTARARHGQGALTLYGTASGVVKPGEPTDVKVVLQASGTIRGTVFRPADTPEGKRPAFGAEVRILLQDDAGHSRGEIPLLVQDDGSYVAKGVPHGRFAVRVFDPMSNGRAARDGFHLEGRELVVPEILIDDQPPAPVFVDPAAGAVRRRFGGLLVIDVPGGDVDPSSIVVRYPTGGYQVANAFTYAEQGRFTGGLEASWVGLGSNRLTVTVKDLAGNSGDGEVSFTVEGGTVRGTVIGSDGQPAAGVPVKLGSFDLVTDASGVYRKDGLRSGSHSAQATDPVTGLESPSKSGFLEDGGELVLDDLILPAAGTISGKVVHADSNDAEAGISVAVGGRTYLTQAGGVFTTAPLLPGTYTIDATAPNGDLGRTTVDVEAGAPTPATVRLNGVGTVSVTVKNASGGLVEGALVTVHTTAPFPSPSPQSTNALGVADFSAVLAGTVTVKAKYRGLEGEAVPQVLLDNQHLDFAVSLEPAARLHGTVRRSNGQAAAATVKLSGPRNETKPTNPDGTFEFTNVRFGDFRIEAEAADGDRGVGKGAVSEPTPPGIDVVLAGFRDLTVTVESAQDQPVSGATVTVMSVAFGYLDSRSTDGSGQAEFSHLLAGEMDVRAEKYPLSTEQRITLPPGDPTAFPLTLRLENVGSIAGVVHAPGGGDGVKGATISAGGRSTTSEDDGSYLLDGLAPGFYTVEARLDGFRRAWVGGVEVKRGDTTNLPLELVGIGTVKGVVRGQSAPVEGASVTIVVPGIFGGHYSFNTPASGEYQFAGIPVQADLFAITARKGTGSADAKGRIESHEQALPMDLDLLPNAISVPAMLTDGNNLSWTIQPDGSVTGTSLFMGAQTGGPRLSLSQGSQVATFVGRGQAGLEETEEAQREIVLHQEGLLGLKVTRKVFIPQGGYFLRYLEVLENDGDFPVELDVSLDSTLESRWTQAGTPKVLGRVAPGFAVVDDVETRDFYDFTGQIPPFAVAFASSEATAPEVDVTAYALRYRWAGVTVPARGKTALLHVWTAQADRVRADASGARLASLPPELLTGMSVEEGATVGLAAQRRDRHRARAGGRRSDARVRATDLQEQEPALRSPAPGHLQGRRELPAGGHGLFHGPAGALRPEGPLVRRNLPGCDGGGRLPIRRGGGAVDGQRSRAQGEQHVARLLAGERDRQRSGYSLVRRARRFPRPGQDSQPRSRLPEAGDGARRSRPWPAQQWGLLREPGASRASGHRWAAPPVGRAGGPAGACPRRRRRPARARGRRADRAVHRPARGPKPGPGGVPGSGGRRPRTGAARRAGRCVHGHRHPRGVSGTRRNLAYRWSQGPRDRTCLAARPEHGPGWAAGPMAGRSRRDVRATGVPPVRRRDRLRTRSRGGGRQEEDGGPAVPRVRIGKGVPQDLRGARDRGAGLSAGVERLRPVQVRRLRRPFRVQ